MKQIIIALPVLGCGLAGSQASISSQMHGGIKNREGFGRIVSNNFLVGSGFYPHAWFAGSGDIFTRNIVWRDYQPARMYPPPWGKEMDFNLSYRAGASRAPATQTQLQSGRDAHSIDPSVKTRLTTSPPCSDRCRLRLPTLLSTSASAATRWI